MRTAAEQLLADLIEECSATGSCIDSKALAEAQAHMKRVRDAEEDELRYAGIPTNLPPTERTFQVIMRIDAWQTYSTDVDATSMAEALKIAKGRTLDAWDDTGIVTFDDTLFVVLDEAGNEHEEGEILA